MRTSVALLVIAASALAGAQPVPSNAELADAMEKAYKALPAFKCEVDDRVTILGKPVIPPGEFGEAVLGWGFASGSRTATVVHKSGKLRFDLHTPD
ncbi:MAG TPA: hypothetical protein VK171_01815, partial [Fimbriimonas sp.]|nr:hypothetical protein [Fimbriimonas sp.]